jgi:hypothetical protein
VDDAAEAHRAAVIAAVLGVLGTSLGTLGFWPISGWGLRAVQGAGILINAAAFGVLRASGAPRSRARSNALFLLVLVPTAVMAWMVDDARAAQSAHWVPYEPSKLSALTLAIIAPPGWPIGMVAILMFVGSALVHHLLLANAFRERMWAGEPFGILAYGLFALVVLGFKQRSYTLRGELEHERSEKLALERVARVAMALRDLANTPVQTLELVRQKLLTDAPQLGVQTEIMGRALERLRRLNDILAPYQSAVVWDGEETTVEREILSAKAPLSAPARTRRRARS